jgi:hypothetical protein
MLATHETRYRICFEPHARGLESLAGLSWNNEGVVRENDDVPRPSAQHEREREKMLRVIGRKRDTAASHDDDVVKHVGAPV